MSQERVKLDCIISGSLPFKLTTVGEVLRPSLVKEYNPLINLSALLLYSAGDVYPSSQHVGSPWNVCLQVHKVYSRCISSRKTIILTDKSVLYTSVKQKGALMVCSFSTNFSLLNRHTSTDFEDILTDHVTWCLLAVLEFIALTWNGGGGGERMGGRPYIKFKLCPFAIYSCVKEKGYSCYISFFTNFEDIFTDHVTWCLLAVLEFIALTWNGGGGERMGGRPYIKFKLCPFAIYSCVKEKGYSCYISFFTNFALIYWTCLIRFGEKIHRSCNLPHTVRDLD